MAALRLTRPSSPPQITAIPQRVIEDFIRKVTEAGCHRRFLEDTRESLAART